MKRMASKMSVLAVAAVVAGTAVEVGASVITSNTFSIGYGFTAAGWDNSETAGANTQVLGDFALVVTGVSNAFSSAGATFPGRVLTNGGAGGYTSTSTGDTYTIDAFYTGGLAGVGATPFTLVIDSISMYVGNQTTSSLTNTDTGGVDLINWTETTPGNVGASATLDVGAPGNRLLASAYDQLVWNPGEVAVAGTSDSRTFTLDTNAGFTSWADGFEVIGHIEYNAVPEPASFAVMGLGLLVACSRVRKA